MSQVELFATAPYLALSIALAGVTWRLFAVPGAEARERQRRRARRLLATSRAWRIAFSVIVAAHLAGLLIPRQILVWNQHPARLLALEVTGMAFALVALFGLAASLRAGWNADPEHPLSVTDAVVVALVVVLVLSGLGVALFYRWASSWAMTAVVPYVRSLLWLAPEAHGMAALPLLVRFHVLSFFTLLAVLPWSSLGHLLGRVRSPGRDRRIAVGS